MTNSLRLRHCGTKIVLHTFVVFGLCPTLAAQSGSYLFRTVAGCSPFPACGLGSGGLATNGDGGPALFAGLASPGGITVDSKGNVFVVDVGSYLIRKVSPQGIISTVAGNGTIGFSGDGGPAISAQFHFDPYYPPGLAVDASGNLFVADALNDRIRQVSPEGIITTVVGTGFAGFFGDGGPATSAQLAHPNGIAIDGFGNLLIADSGNARVRSVSSQGTITTLVGGGNNPGDGVPATSARLGNPIGVALDGGGNLFILELFDQQNAGRVREVSLLGTIGTVTGGGSSNPIDGGQAISAQLLQPTSIAVDLLGNLFIADGYANCVFEVTPQGVINKIVSGNASFSGFSGFGGPSVAAVIGSEKAIVTDNSGDILIADPFGTAIRELIPSPAPLSGCLYSLDQPAQDFQAGGGTNAVGVLTNGGNCAWLAQSYSSWITVNSPTGTATGLGLVAYTVSPNPNSLPRSGTVWIGGKPLVVNQSGSPCSFGVTPLGGVQVPASGEIGVSFTVTASAADCQWSAAATVGWILVSGSTGTGGGTVTFTVGLNTGGQRLGAVTVTGQQSGIATLAVTQYAASDVNGDGATTVSDIQVVINEALGVAKANNDLNFDGGVNAVDVQITIKALLQPGCSIGGPLTLNTCTMSFTNVTAQIQQNLNVTATGASTNFTAVSSETSCTNHTWLSIAAGSYTASSANTPIQVTVNPSGISAGTTCAGIITLVSSTATQTVNVSMVVGTDLTNLSIAATLVPSGSNYSTTGTAVLTGGIAATGTFSATLSAATIATGGASPFTITLSGGTLTGSLTIPAAVFTAILAGAGSASGASATFTSGTGTYDGDTGTFPNLSGSGGVGAGGITMNFSGGGTIQPSPLSTDHKSLIFTAPVGGAATSLPVSVTSVPSSAVILTTVVEQTSPGVPWLSVSPSGGQTPIGLAVTANPSALSVGTYTGSIVISVFGGSSSISVGVTLTVTSILASPPSLTFETSVGNVPLVHSVTLGAAVPVTFTAAAATTSGGKWLAVAPISGLISGYAAVTAIPDGAIVPALSPGTYNGTITITPTSGQSLVPVVLTVMLTVTPDPEPLR